jgi:hypothetical protein
MGVLAQHSHTFPFFTAIPSEPYYLRGRIF